MRYSSGRQFKEEANKSLAFIGMSGVGKTHLSHKLSEGGDWLNFSVDKRIGNHYLKNDILGALKKEEPKELVSDLLSSDSLKPLSHYLGKPGSREQGGISFKEYKKRQSKHRAAEIRSLLDSSGYLDALKDFSEFSYENFVCDTGGSISELVNPENDHDEILLTMSRKMLFVYIEASEKHEKQLFERFNNDPKPMYYEPKFLESSWKNYISSRKINEWQVNPDDFIRWGFKKLIYRRKPIYEKIASKWGVSISASDVESVKSSNELFELIGYAIDNSDSVNRSELHLGSSFQKQRERIKMSRSRVARLLDISDGELKKIEIRKQDLSEELEKRIFRLLFAEPIRREIEKKVQNGNELVVPALDS